MPFKANASRRHHIPKQTRKVSNWADYNASLRQRGSLTPVPPPQIAPEVQQQVDAAKQAIGAVGVPARLVRPHPVIGAWLAEREEERSRARRERDPWRRNLAPPDWV
jgi:hypothetical protein